MKTGKILACEKLPNSSKLLKSTVEIGGETATYNVKEKSSLLFYALGLIVLLIIGGAAYYFTKGGGNMEKLSEQIKELTNSIKSKK